jgi:hypothetical protein
MRSILIAEKMKKDGDEGGWMRTLYSLLILIKFCWNILAFVRGKRSRHCSYEMEWEYVWSDSLRKKR